MGGSEYRNTANKIEKTPHHRKQNRTNTASPQEILSTHRHRKIYLVLIFFFKKKRHHRYFYFSNKRKTSQDIPTAVSACKIPCCRLHFTRRH